MHVLFFDLLGFASAVLGLSDEEETTLLKEIRLSDRRRSAFMPADGYDSFSSVHRLYDCYTTFQRRLRQELETLEEFGGRRGQGVRSVIFSDSVFLEWPEPIGALADRLFVALLYSHVPSRAAIVSGSMASFEWAVRAADVGHFHAQVPFLGKGVVWAYFAESRGPKGPRIVLDTATAEALLSVSQELALPVLPEEATRIVTHELNLLAWGGRSSGWRDEKHTFLDSRFAKLRDTAPDEAKPSYDAARKALARMKQLL